MTSRLAELRQKSKLRKEYLKVTLGVDNLSEALGSDAVEPTSDNTRNSNNGDSLQPLSKKRYKKYFPHTPS